MNHVIYDIESYPNVFTIAIGDTLGSPPIAYEISPRVNHFTMILQALLTLRQQGFSMIGFNNINYDYPVIHDLIMNATGATANLPGEDLAYSIFLKSDSIIQSKRGTFTSVYEGEVKIPQIDLLKIKHFDNANRYTSLKCLEFKMRSENLQDLPFEPGVPLYEDQIDQLIEYNKKDVMETLAFYNHCIKDIQFRIEASSNLSMNVMNYNDTKIGQEFMVSRLEGELGPQICYTRKGRSKKPNQTKRPEINIADVIDPRVEFKTNELNAIKNWMSNQVITQTKGVFTDLDMINNPGSDWLQPYLDKISEMIIEEGKHRKSVKKVSSRTQIVHIETGHILYTFSNKGSQKKINDIRSQYPDNELDFQLIKHTLPKLCVPFNDVLLVYGLGGLHGSLHNKHVSSDDEWLIVDADVTSYYPSTAVTTGAYPEHLTEQFTPIYKSLIAERLQYDKKSVESAALKLALNGVYGKTNDKYSPFYDPQCTMRITLNGQLFLSMLIENLSIGLGEDFCLIQANTDGITVKVKRDRGTDFATICQNWRELTELKLEYAFYNDMYIKDVNNYLAVKTDGSTKAVGCYADPVPTTNPKGDWAKNHNHLVVYKTAVKCLLNPELDVETEVKNHDDIYDFMFYFKAGGKTFRRLELHYDDNRGNGETIQKRSRFLVTTYGAKLYKVLDPSSSNPEDERFVGEKADWFVTEVNNMHDLDHQSLFDKLDYDYYIQEVKKLLKLEKLELKRKSEVVIEEIPGTCTHIDNVEPIEVTDSTLSQVDQLMGN